MYLECYKEQNPHYIPYVQTICSYIRFNVVNTSNNRSINQLVIPSYNDISSKCNCITPITELLNYI